MVFLFFGIIMVMWEMFFCFVDFIVKFLMLKLWWVNSLVMWVSILVLFLIKIERVCFMGGKEGDCWWLLG